MVNLFGTKRQAITKHLLNIYECKELKKEATSSILELVRKEGNRIEESASLKSEAPDEFFISLCGWSLESIFEKIE